jgi:hypothetical protein
MIKSLDQLLKNGEEYEFFLHIDRVYAHDWLMKGQWKSADSLYLLTGANCFSEEQLLFVGGLKRFGVQTRKQYEAWYGFWSEWHQSMDAKKKNDFYDAFFSEGHVERFLPRRTWDGKFIETVENIIYVISGAHPEDTPIKCQAANLGRENYGTLGILDRFGIGLYEMIVFTASRNPGKRVEMVINKLKECQKIIGDMISELEREFPRRSRDSSKERLG